MTSEIFQQRIYQSMSLKYIHGKNQYVAVGIGDDNKENQEPIKFKSLWRKLTVAIGIGIEVIIDDLIND